MSFVYSPAPPDLRPWATGFGERHDVHASGLMRELPMPRSAVQIMMGGDYHLTGEAPAPRAGLWGPVLEPGRAWTAAPAAVFIAFLTGWGAVCLSRLQLVSLADQRIDLATVIPSAQVDLADPIIHSPDFHSRQQVACDWFRRRFGAHDRTPTSTLALNDRIASGGWRGPVESLAKSIGLTPRGLGKAFEREPGCSPKRLLRLARLQRVLSAVHPRPWTGRSDTDPFLEFHDQAHMDRDFRKLTGLSRSEYVAAKKSRGDALVFTVI